MARPKKTPSVPNFIDLRQETLQRNNNLIDDVIRPLLPKRLLLSRGRLIAIGVVVIVIAIVTIIANHHPKLRVSSPIPASISRAVPFPIYYPQQQKLPAGYSFEASSLSAASGAVVYTVRIPNNQQVIITEQATPPANQLAMFHSQRLPLYTNVATLIGTARVSALNNRSFTSLPTTQTWLLISAPYAIDQNQLKQLLNSLTH